MWLLAAAVGAVVSGVGAIVYGGISLYNYINTDKAAHAAEKAASATPPPLNYKDKKDTEDKKIIGLKSPHLIPAGINLTPYAATIDFDSTTYADKCLLQLTNGSGFTTYLNDFSIRGQPVYRYAGKSGYRWEYKNQADIDANGEQEYKISSNYITSAAQCEDVGDHVRKELEAHDMYTVTLHGVHPYYQVGDKYELNVYYQLPTMTLPTELISVDVEVRGVSIARDFDGIGQTALSLRVPSGAWNKTTAIRAAMLSTGLPYDKLNRSNVLTIGAYDYPGQADIYCDGVDDDVQIQEAIDELSATGGGTIRISRGSFIFSAHISMKGNITLIGEGDSTKISPNDNTIDMLIYSSTGGGQFISDFCIDGDYQNITYSLQAGVYKYIIYDPSADNLRANNITIQNYQIENSSGTTAGIRAFNELSGITNCFVKNFYSADATAGIWVVGYYNCKNIINSKVGYIELDGANKSIKGMENCANVTCAVIVGNTAPQIIGIDNTSYITSSSFEGNIGTVTSGYNYSKNITVSSSMGNTGSSTERGFSSCSSVQQCKTDDTTKYYVSYADAANTFALACADTAAGGYNS